MLVNTPDFSKASSCSPENRTGRLGTGEMLPAPPRQGTLQSRRPGKNPFLGSAPRPKSSSWLSELMPGSLSQSIVWWLFKRLRRLYWTLVPSTGLWQRKYSDQMVGLGPWKRPLFHCTNACPGLRNPSSASPSLRHFSGLKWIYSILPLCCHGPLFTSQGTSCILTSIS